MPDENNIINALLTKGWGLKEAKALAASPPAGGTEGGLEHYIADLNTLIEAYKLKEQHHAAAVALAGNQDREIDRLSKRVKTLTEQIASMEEAIDGLTEDYDTILHQLNDARRWAAAWKAAAKLERQIAKDFGSLLDRDER